MKLEFQAINTEKKTISQNFRIYFITVYFRLDESNIVGCYALLTYL